MSNSERDYANSIYDSMGRWVEDKAKRQQDTRIKTLEALLREARQYVSDAGVVDEDSETQRNSAYLLIEIDAALDKGQLA